MSRGVEKLLRRGLAHQQSGRLDEAEPLYSAAVERDPDNADAWHLLSRLSLERGRWKEAAARALQAIRRQAAIPAFHSTLGEILAAQGRSWEASLCYREALRLDPGFVPALVNLGNALQNQGQHREACVAYWRAIQAQPLCASAFSNLGNALRAEGRRDEALVCYQEALRLDPDHSEAAVNLAAAHLEAGRHAAAEACARRALARRPHLAAALSNLAVALLEQRRYAEAEEAARQAIAAAPAAAHLYCNLGSVLLQQKRCHEAEAACRQALLLEPGYAEARHNLATALHFQDRLEDAAREFESVLQTRPESADTWTNFGAVRQAQGRNPEALACFEKALRRDPGHAKAHFCRSLSNLLADRLAEGFAEYEWRANVLPENPRAASYPRWDGRPLSGRTILLYAEQGLGDTIQFVRYAPLVAAGGGRVVIECQDTVAPLVAGMEEVDQVVTPNCGLPPFEVQAALMSLPALIGTTLDTIPAHVPYLHVAPERVRSIRDALGPSTRIRAGLVWAGNRDHPNDGKRSITLGTLASLDCIPGVEWYSLQAGERARDDSRRAAPWIRPILPEPCRVEDLAATMCCLDLIVSVDTMPAHLAGALARPVWTLLPWAPDWRWLEQREDSPWYPTMRLFRQPAAGDWETVIARIAAEMQQSLKLPPVRPMSLNESQAARRQTASREPGSGRMPQHPKQDVKS